LDLIEGFKQMMGEPVIVNRPVVSLDISVLLRLPKLEKSMRIPLCEPVRFSVWNGVMK